MVRNVISAIVVLLALTLSAEAGEIEYGHVRELQGVEGVFVGTEPAARALGEMASERLAELLPALALVQSEEDARVLLAFSRRQASPDSPDPTLRYITTGTVIRLVSSSTTHLIIEFVSTEESEEAAVDEIVKRFVNELRRHNRDRFGPPDPSLATDKKRFRSTAGLRPGLTKAEVRAAIGSPTKVHPKAAFMQTWRYETTDGTIRVVFAGNNVIDVQTLNSKK